MKLDAKGGAGLGGLAGILVGAVFSATRYDLTKVDQMQQAVGSILATFILGAVVGWFVGKSNDG